MAPPVCQMLPAEAQVFVFPSGGTRPFAPAVGQQVFVWLRSDKSTGRAVVKQLPDPDAAPPARYNVQYASDGTAYWARLERLLPIYHAPCTLLICRTTTDYRRLARSQVDAVDQVAEVGSSYGMCTHVLSQHCASVVGIDNSSQLVAEARRRYPGLRFEHLDALLDKDGLLELLRPCSKVFLDIGGNRQLESLLELIPLVMRHARPQLVVVKSEQLFEQAQRHLASTTAVHEPGTADASAASPSRAAVPPPQLLGNAAAASRTRTTTAHPPTSSSSNGGRSKRCDCSQTVQQPATAPESAPCEPNSQPPNQVDGGRSTAAFLDSGLTRPVSTASTAPRSCCRHSSSSASTPFPIPASSSTSCTDPAPSSAACLAAATAGIQLLALPSQTTAATEPAGLTTARATITSIISPEATQASSLSPRRADLSTAEASVQLHRLPGWLPDPSAWWHAMLLSHAPAQFGGSASQTAGGQGGAEPWFLAARQNGFRRTCMKYPQKRSPAGVRICRPFNYDTCHKAEACPFDHTHCHHCLGVGHRARACTVGTAAAAEPSDLVPTPT